MIMRSVAVWMAILGLIGLAACDAGAPAPPRAPQPNGVVEDNLEDDFVAQDAKPYASRDKSKDGKIVGKVILKGKAPKMPNISFDSEAICHEKHKGSPVKNETVIVNDKGELRNVFVYVRRGAKGWSFEKQEKPIEITQVGCMYKPHVQGMQINQPMKILNKDALLHNIHAVPENNTEFNFGQANVGEDLLTTTSSKGRTFSKSEVMVRIKCDVHGWMGAYVGVRRVPFFAVTDDDGSFTIEGVPPGTYEIRAWHEFYGNKNAKPKPTRELRKKGKVVKPGETITVNFEFKG